MLFHARYYSHDESHVNYRIGLDYFHAIRE